MCMVSLMVEQAPQQWGQPSTWPHQTIVDVAEILRKLEAIDKKLGAPDCVDAKKEKFLRELDERLERLEALHQHQV